MISFGSKKPLSPWWDRRCTAKAWADRNWRWQTWQNIATSFEPFVEKKVLFIRGRISFFELKQIIFWPLLDKTFDKESHLYHLTTIRRCVFLPDVVWEDVSSSFCRKTDIQLWPRGRCRREASMLDARSTFCHTECIAEPAKGKIYWSTNKSSKSVSLVFVDQNL